MVSRVRKDKAQFKVVESARKLYFFIKKDDWGSYWSVNTSPYNRNKFKIFLIVEGVVCYKNDMDDRVSPFDDAVQKAYQNYLVESILLGD